MKARVNKKSITISEIYNEGMLEQLYTMCEKSGCEYKLKDFSTKASVTGTQDQLSKFVDVWNGDDEEETKEPMFNVGDEITIKDWDSLVEEFGLTEYGHINGQVYLLEGMKEYCGCTVTVTSVNPYTCTYGFDFKLTTGPYTDRESFHIEEEYLVK